MLNEQIKNRFYLLKSVMFAAETLKRKFNQFYKQHNLYVFQWSNLRINCLLFGRVYKQVFRYRKWASLENEIKLHLQFIYKKYA